jgi:hypothetical protein
VNQTLANYIWMATSHIDANIKLEFIHPNGLIYSVKIEYQTMHDQNNILNQTHKRWKLWIKCHGLCHMTYSIILPNLPKLGWTKVIHQFSILQHHNGTMWDGGQHVTKDYFIQFFTQWCFMYIILPIWFVVRSTLQLVDKLPINFSRLLSSFHT